MFWKINTKDEDTMQKRFPLGYIDLEDGRYLKKLSEEKTDAGKLASFLLGKTRGASTGRAKGISEALKKSCMEFSRDKGVKRNRNDKVN